MQKKDLAIIIVTYNKHYLTEDCLNSVFNNCNKAETEVIVVDNCSTEQGIELIKTKFPDIKLIRNSQNSGFSKAVNIGIKASSANHVLLLNNDVYFSKDIFSKPLSKLKNCRETGVVTIQCRYPNQKIQRNISKYPSILRDIHTLFFLDFFLPSRVNRILFPSLYPSIERTQTVDYCWGTYFMFRRVDILRMRNKRLNEQFFMYCEDLVWSYQFKKLGLKIKYISDVFMYHLHGGSSRDKNKNEKMFVMNKMNELIFINSTSPWYKFATMFLMRLLWNLILSIKHRQHRLIFKNYLLFLRNRKMLEI